MCVAAYKILFWTELVQNERLKKEDKCIICAVMIRCVYAHNWFFVRYECDKYDVQLVVKLIKHAGKSVESVKYLMLK